MTRSNDINGSSDELTRADVKPPLWWVKPFIEALEHHDSINSAALAIGITRHRIQQYRHGSNEINAAIDAAQERWTKEKEEVKRQAAEKQRAYIDELRTGEAELTQGDIIAEAEDVACWDGLTFREALTVLIEEGYGDETSRHRNGGRIKHRVARWVVESRRITEYATEEDAAMSFVCRAVDCARKDIEIRNLCLHHAQRYQAGKSVKVRPQASGVKLCMNGHDLSDLKNRNAAGTCKICSNQRSREHQRTAEAKARRKKWGEENKERLYQQYRARYLATLGQHRQRARQYYEANKDEILARNNAWKARNPEKFRQYGRDWWLRNRYGLSLDEFTAMLEDQGGGCAICGVTLNSNGKHLAQDHDEDTGMTRGILCNWCNSGIGFFDHDPELLERARDYQACWNELIMEVMEDEDGE